MILLDTDINQGDIITHKISPELKYYVCGFEIEEIDESGLVKSYRIIANNDAMDLQAFKRFEVDLVESRANNV